MSKRLIIITTLFILLFSSTIAQKDSLVKKSFFAIKTNLLSLSLNAIGVVNSGALTIERGFLQRHSLQITASFSKHIAIKSNAWHIIPDYKFFLNNKTSFKGFYTGLYLKYLHETDSDLFSSGNDGNQYISKIYQSYGTGITFGFQTYIRKHFTLDFLLGIGGKYTTRQVYVPSIYYATAPSYKLDNNYPAVFLDGRAAINIGYKF